MPRAHQIARWISCITLLAIAGVLSCTNDNPSEPTAPQSPVPSLGVVSGVVFDDAVTDGVFDPAMEVGHAHKSIWAYAVPSTGPQQFAAFKKTDASGRYTLSGLPAGVYSLTVYGAENWTHTTINPLTVTLLEDDDGDVIAVDHADFGFVDPNPPDSRVIFRANVRADQELETAFVNPPSAASQHYELRITAPIHIRAPVGAIVGSRVSINDTLVWEIACEIRRRPADCGSINETHFDVRVGLPPRLIAFGANDIKIEVDGWGEPFWIYTIWRFRDADAP